MRFDTTSFSGHMPLFEKKLGKNKPLKMKIKFSHFETQFGKFDSDCIFDYTMGISWYLDNLGSKELVYDEIKMITSANLGTDNDRLFINILNHKLDISPNTMTKKLPIRNSMNMSTHDYREFLSSFQFTNKWMVKWM